MAENTAPQQAVAALPASRLPIAPQLAREFDVNATEWRVLVDQIFPNAKTVAAIGMALAYCRARKLDIYKRPVHVVPMWSSALGAMVETVWPGISEIRTTAARTGQYAGIDAVVFGPMIEREFKGTTGRNNEAISKTVKFPEWASVIAYRMIDGQRCPFNAIVYWEEAYATIGKTEVPNDMWQSRPRGQLGKCVEAAVLRMAFPEEVGNMLSAEEMEGRVIDATAAAVPTASRRPAMPEIPDAPAAPAIAQQTQVPMQTVTTDEREKVNTPEIVHEERKVDQAPAAEVEEPDPWGDATKPVATVAPNFDAVKEGDTADLVDTSDEGRELATVDGLLATARDLETLDRLWKQSDAQVTFADDPDNLSRAAELYAKHKARIERADLEAAGQGSMFPGDR